MVLMKRANVVREVDKSEVELYEKEGFITYEQYLKEHKEQVEKQKQEEKQKGKPGRPPKSPEDE